MQVAASSEAKEAMGAARANFLNQQKQLQQQGNSVFQTAAIKASEPQTQQTLDQGAQQRTQLSQALKQTAQPMTQPLAANAPNTYQVSDSPISRAQSINTGQGAAVGADATAAAAKQGAWGDWQTAQALNNAEANRNLMPIESASRGNASLFPTELEVASHAGDELNGWGQFVSSLGSLAMMGGAMGLGAGAGSIPASQTAAIQSEMAGQGAMGLTGGPAFPSFSSIAPATYTGQNLWSFL